MVHVKRPAVAVVDEVAGLEGLLTAGKGAGDRPDGALGLVGRELLS